MRVAVTRDLVCDVELVNIFPIFVESSVQFRVCVDAFGNWGVIDVLFEEAEVVWEVVCREHAVAFVFVGGIDCLVTA